MKSAAGRKRNLRNMNPWDLWRKQCKSKFKGSQIFAAWQVSGNTKNRLTWFVFDKHNQPVQFGNFPDIDSQ